MRIITGIYKGKMIKQPQGIRPTQNKVRKAVFDILQDVRGFSFLELFAGSGAVGIEALSNSAGQVVFAEKDKKCAEVIGTNIRLLGCQDKAGVFGIDAFKAIKRLSQSRKRFDVIFLDPPYYNDIAKKTLQAISGCDILAPNGLIIVEHFKKDNLPQVLGDLVLFKQKIYGDTVLSLYKKCRGRACPVPL